MAEFLTILGESYPIRHVLPIVHTGGSDEEPPFLRPIPEAEFFKAWVYEPTAMETRTFEYQNRTITLRMHWFGNAGVAWYSYAISPTQRAEIRFAAFGCHHRWTAEVTSEGTDLVCDNCSQVHHLKEG